MTQEELHKELRTQFVIPVLRHKKKDVLVEASLALARGGFQIIEVTLMSDDAHAAIQTLSSFAETTNQKARVLVGAGTVRTVKQAELVIRDGAQFLVSPGFDRGVADACAEADRLYIPGVLSPTEVMAAANHGLSLLKVFPISSVGGANYLKQLSGPFPDLDWMATGGVAVSDLGQFKKVGATAVGLSLPQLFPAGTIESGNWAEAELAAKKLHEEIERLRSV